MGWAVTRITELATDVSVREVIQKRKCAARITPISVMIRNVVGGRERNSFRIFGENITTGVIRSVVKRRRKNEMERGGASAVTMNIAAVDAQSTERNNPPIAVFFILMKMDNTYGLFSTFDIVRILDEVHRLET